MKQKSFIVPFDFTAVAVIALEHAVETAKKSNAQVNLLHVIDHENQISQNAARLEEVANAHTNHQVEVKAFVRIGNIFTAISEFAAECQAELIFMGTHGAHGWQHVVGSHALRVVTSSSVPFIIVQEKKISEGGYKSIVVPLDLHKETKQKLSVVSKLARYLGATIHVVTPEETDSYLKHQVETNILFAESYFKEMNLEVTFAVLPGQDFEKEVVRHSVSVNADLVAIMNLNRNSLLGIFTTSYEQYLITNDALIPVLILNPVETTEVYGAWFD